MRLCFLLLTASAASVFAQTPEIRRAVPAGTPPPATPPEVRRAEAVDPATYQNPDWMQRVPRAEPVHPVPTPRTTPPPVPALTPLPLTPAETPPQAPSTPPPPDSTSADQAPGPEMNVSTENRSLLAANGFYRRKMYDMAIYEFERFLIAESTAPGRDGALFRLGESHRYLNHEQAARDAYQRLLAEFREGEFVGSGAYRLGEILYTEGNLGVAVGMFQKAAANSKEAAVKLSAMYYEARALDKLGRRPQAAKKFAEISRVEGDNPYRETALFYLAEDAAKTGRKQDAFDAYEKLSQSAEKPEMRVEATVKAAAIAAEQGQAARARELFDKALSMSEIGDWKGVARLGVLRLAYEAGDYTHAAALTDEDMRALPASSVAEALLISANARRQLGQTAKALEFYDRILRDYPTSTAAAQAKFQRLVCLDATGSGDIARQVDDFLATSTDPRERVQATLLKAETVFKTGDYAAAAPLYASVLKDTLPKRLRSQARYKLGWCQTQLKQYAEAAKTFTVFMQEDPNSPQVSAALAQRAFALQQAKAYDEAMRDFDRLITDFPKAKEREMALQQKALILGQQEKYDAMSKVFALLLKEYPKSKAAAQAEFWIGWAANEKKDYPAAIEHLKKARELDAKAFGPRATLNLVLAYYAAQDRDAVATEVAAMEIENVPPNVLLWLGSKYYEDGDLKKAEIFLAPTAVQGAAAASNPELLLALAKVRLAQKKYASAGEPIRQYIAVARDPLSRAKGLLASAELSLGTGNYEDADKILQEAQLLQPEGRYNGEARMLAAEVQMRRGNYNEAARSLMTIALLYDDPAIAPRALEQAAKAYQKAGNEAEAKKALAERDARYPKGDGGSAKVE
jgi:TolA-binding protein